MALLLSTQARDCRVGGGLLYRSQNSRVTTAAAQAAIQSLDYLRFRRLRVNLEESDRPQDHSGYTVSALHCALVQESLLHTMKFSCRRQAFDGEDLLPCNGCYRRDTRYDRLSVEHHRTCAALPFATTVLGSGEIEIFANYFKKRAFARGIDGALLTVDR